MPPNHFAFVRTILPGLADKTQAKRRQHLPDTHYPFERQPVVRMLSHIMPINSPPLAVLPPWINRQAADIVPPTADTLCHLLCHRKKRLCLQLCYTFLAFAVRNYSVHYSAENRLTVEQPLSVAIAPLFRNKEYCIARICFLCCLI